MAQEQNLSSVLEIRGTNRFKVIKPSSHLPLYIDTFILVFMLKIQYKVHGTYILFIDLKKLDMIRTCNHVLLYEAL